MKLKSILALILFASWGCEEYFEPDIDSQVSHYVFEGTITNQLKIHQVKISQTVGFNDTSIYLKVKEAKLWIEDTDGTSFELIDDGRGTYKTKDSVAGIINHQYRLKALMPDNRIYVSEFEKMLPAAPVDSVNCKFDQTVSWVDNGMGYFQKITTDGIRLYATSKPDGYTPFYKYNCKFIFQTVQYHEGSGLTMSHWIYIYEPGNSGGSIYLANSRDYTNNRILMAPLHFIKKELLFKSFNYVDTLPFVCRQQGILVNIEQMSLSEKAYNFWKTILEQKGTSNYLFDPVESQVVGNMHCLGDTNELVFGFFGASSVTDKLNAFHLTPQNGIIAMPIVNYPVLNFTWIYLTKPDFYVEFY